MNQDKSELLDTAAFKPLDNAAAEAQAEAHNAGGAQTASAGIGNAAGEINAGDLAAAIGAGSNSENNLLHTASSDTGVANQTILPGEIGAGDASDNSDISGGDRDVSGKTNALQR